MNPPDVRAFRKLSGRGNLVAISKQIPADLETPVSSFLKLASHLPHAFLLESAEQEERIGRYSIIGLEPDEILVDQNASVCLIQKGRSRPQRIEQPLVEILEDRLAAYHLANPEDLPAFSGGYVGYFGYESVQHFEDIHLSEKKSGPQMPDAVFYLTRNFLVFDHFRKTLTIVTIVPADKTARASRSLQKARTFIERTVRRLRAPLKHPQAKTRKQTDKFQSNMSRSQFETKVNKIKAYIRAGDCIQTVLSQRFRIPSPGNDFQIYRALRSINPSPYMFYFQHGKMRIIGASPELLVRKQGREAEVRPIAGTRPRGNDANEDARFRESLKKSKKEMAEHLMLVDLGRNDLGRVCEFKSIQVENFAHIENFSHVMHLVSDVKGKLAKGKNAFDLLKATFPAGTVTGAPKIRAMQIIDELETERRGVYAGSLGFFSFTKNLEMCITIRTLVSTGGYLYLQAGAGIVKDSNPGKEYQETVNKARALVEAIRHQEQFQ